MRLIRFIAAAFIFCSVPVTDSRTALPYSPSLWYGHGTTAVLMRSPKALVAGIDSRETVLKYGDGAPGAEHGEVCKVARVGSFFAMVAGIDRGSNGYNALTEVVGASQADESLDALARRAKLAVEGPLVSLIGQLRNSDPTGFERRFSGQNVLELSLLGIEKRVTEIIVLEASVDTGAAGPAGLVWRKTRCPGDCPRESTAYFLGVHAEIDDAVRRNPKLLTPFSGERVGKLIELEEISQPDLVGGRLSTIGLSPEGAVIAPGACSELSGRP